MQDSTLSRVRATVYSILSSFSIYAREGEKYMACLIVWGSTGQTIYISGRPSSSSSSETIQNDELECKRANTHTHTCREREREETSETLSPHPYIEQHPAHLETNIEIVKCWKVRPTYRVVKFCPSFVSLSTRGCFGSCLNFNRFIHIQSCWVNSYQFIQVHIISFFLADRLYVTKLKYIG